MQKEGARMRKASGSRPRDAAAELIECYIRSQNLSPHDRLPSERAMCEMWGLNRSTLRTAIRRLTEEGWLYSVLGSGTFVAPPKLERDLQDARSLTETVRDAGRMIRSQVLDLRITECSAWLSGKLGCAPGHPVFFLRRLRFLDNVPFTIETCYLDHEVCPGIENGDYCKGSLYQALGALGVNPVQGSEHIGITYATEEEAALLEVPEECPLFFLSGTSMNAEGRTIEYFKAVVRYDKVRFSSVLRRGT